MKRDRSPVENQWKKADVDVLKIAFLTASSRPFFCRFIHSPSSDQKLLLLNHRIGKAIALLWVNMQARGLIKLSWSLRWSFAMSWYVSGTAWSAFIKLLVDSVNEDNGNVCKCLATLVNKLMMTSSCYKSGDSMTTAACYKSSVNARLATRMVSRWWQVLIIIQIRFVCF